MYITEKELTIPASQKSQNLLNHIDQTLKFRLKDNDIPLRFAVIQSVDDHYECEFGILSEKKKNNLDNIDSIFRFVPRNVENTNEFNVALLVPTGIGSEIGGHAGDATPVARLLSETCDTLITHPNVVNASDINEMSDDTLYVEGSVLTRLLFTPQWLA